MVVLKVCAALTVPTAATVSHIHGPLYPYRDRLSGHTSPLLPLDHTVDVNEVIKSDSDDDADDP